MKQIETLEQLIERVDKEYCDYRDVEIDKVPIDIFNNSHRTFLYNTMASLVTSLSPERDEQEVIDGVIDAANDCDGSFLEMLVDLLDDKMSYYDEFNPQAVIDDLVDSYLLECE